MQIVSVYKDFVDRTAVEQNGSAAIQKYNRFSRLGELRLLDYLTGDVEGVKPPEPYNVQKLMDWITIMSAKDFKQTVGGTTAKPVDYYRFESLCMIGDYRDEVCGKDVLVSKGDTDIELLGPQQFIRRTKTHIESLIPSAKKPIAQLVGANFEYMPKDLGSVKLQYIRYPKFGEIAIKVDQIYNEEIPDPATSTDYEWPEYARNILLYFIVQQYPMGTREKAIVEQNETVGKGARRE